MADTIAWSRGAEFAATPLQDISVAGVSMGGFKSVGGLSYYEIDSAGHMVPMD